MVNTLNSVSRNMVNAIRQGVALLLLMTPAVCASSPGSSVEEYQSKATFLYNFTKFIEWPQNSFAGRNDPLLFGFIGSHQLSGFVDLFDGKLTQGRSVRAKLCETTTDMGAVHLLFITGSDTTMQSEVLKSLEGKSILTVGESPTFLNDGGIINFVRDGRKVRFEINAVAAKEAKLRISADLMALATRVIQ